MKIFIIALFVSLILGSTTCASQNENESFYNSFFDAFNKTIKLLNLTDLCELIDNAIDKIGQVCNADKEKIAHKLVECILYAIKVYVTDPEAVQKLKNLLEKLNNLGLFDSKIMKLLRGFYYLDYEKLLTSVNLEIFNFVRDEKNTPIFKAMGNFINSNKQLFPELTKFTSTQNKYFKDYIKSMETLKTKTSNRISFFKGMKIAGNLISGAIGAYDKFNRCKNNNTKAYVISAAQAAGNVGVNAAFGSVGSFLGAFIPIPVVGTVVGPFVGGLVGNYIGDWVNSFYDLDC